MFVLLIKHHVFSMLFTHNAPADVDTLLNPGILSSLTTCYLGSVLARMHECVSIQK